MSFTRPVPKPTREYREPKRLRQVSAKRQARIDAGEDRPGLKRSHMRHTPGSTAHSRRDRELGRMLFYRTLACMVREVWLSVVLDQGHNRDGLPEPPECDDVIEIMHLGSKRKRGGWRRADDDTTARGCRVHHRGIDGTVGGKAPWYLALGEDGQAEFKRRLIAIGNDAWMALTPEQRAAWDEEALRQRDDWKRAQREASL